MKKHKTFFTKCSLVFYTCFLTACSNQSGQHNIITDQELKDGWTIIFDGKTLNGWHVFNQGDITSAWSVDSGNLVCNPHAKNVKHGDLVSNKTYENFDLTFEWKISRAGNSGVFINVQEAPEFATTWATGPEYQLLDNTNNEEHGTDSLRMAGSLYGMTALKNKVASKPYAEWNQARILQQNGKITFWLNGIITVEENIHSDRWKALVAGSSLGKFAAFGKATKGKLALQDWTNGVSFRDMKIKVL
jgi:Domain of Unknown Function (DUF1080)